MKLEALIREAALERPGVGMPLSIVHLSKLGWVRAVDEYCDHDDTAWSIWFLVLRKFLASRDHLA